MSRQRGHLRLEGRTWRLLYRARPEPGSRPRQVSHRLGALSELPTRAQARQSADRLLEQIAPRELHAGAAIKWERWCTIYSERHLVLLARGTRETRTSIIDGHLAPAFAGRAVHTIDSAAVQTFVTDQHRAGVAASTIRARFALLRRMLRAAKVAGLAALPVSASDVQFPRDAVVPASVRAKAFTPTEVTAILRAAPEPLGTAVSLARYLGLRCGEVLGLTWSSIDLDHRRVELRQQALSGEIRPLKSTSSAATLSITAPLLARLQAYRLTWTPNPKGLLFADDSGQPLDSAVLRRQLHELLDTLGIPRRGMHGFRHACALAMAAAGVNPEALRRAMRHTNLRTTSVYLTASAEDISAALDAAAM